MPIKSKTQNYCRPTTVTIVLFKKWKINVGKDIEKVEPYFHIAGRNIKWFSHCGKQLYASLKS